MIAPARGALEKARLREAERIDGEILEAIGRAWHDPIDDSEFDRLAREVFAHQFRFNPVYRQFCAMREVASANDVRSWREIPPVPTGAYKVGRWATFPPDREVAAFETSGTTQGTPGTHRFETLALYNAAIVASARRFLFPDTESMACLCLSPRPSEARGSSLVHMFAVFGEAFGAPGTGFFVRPQTGAGFDRAGLETTLTVTTERGAPVALAGAALAFWHVMDALDGEWRLPRGSRTMITGGFKGARRTADAAEVAGRIEHVFGVPMTHQVEEYGMTELSSQYYTDDVRAEVEADRPRDGFRVPPWVRVTITDPRTGAPVRSGSEGVITHYDLANRGSALAVQTSDIGTWTDDGGIRLTGRAPDAEARGCSLAAELWLDAG